MADPKQLAQLLQGNPRFGALAALCDEYSEAERIVAIGALARPEMAKLFERAAEQPLVSLDYLVPAEAPHGASCIWQGKNSLALANRFAKVFTRGAEDGALWGRNTGPMEWLIGPGYFTCTVRPDHPSEFLIDYTREPAQAPPGWPRVKRNASGTSYFVFRNMHDHLRPVGKNVAIGAAFDGPSGRAKGQFFALARSTVQPPGAISG